MSIWQIIRRLVPFIKPHRRWVVLSLGLTLLGALAAQVNPLVLRYTVDTIERLLSEGRTASQGASLLLLISAVLLGKEILNTGVRYGQNLFGEKIRVNVSSRLTQAAVERILTYLLAFYTDPDNQTGILQTRIDRVVEHGTHEELYESDGTYREIFDASARSLNLDKISKTLDAEFTPDPAN